MFSMGFPRFSMVFPGFFHGFSMFLCARCIEDITLTWINMYFKLHVKTERQLCAGFPLIVLSMMDVIYPKKVRWHQVNWNTSYQRARASGGENQRYRSTKGLCKAALS